MLVHPVRPAALLVAALLVGACALPPPAPPTPTRPAAPTATLPPPAASTPTVRATPRPALPTPTPSPSPEPAPSTPEPTSAVPPTPVPGPYRHATVGPPPAAGPALPCLPANSGCARGDPWWAQRDELQLDDPVQLDFLGPGLVVERRHVEAIWLLWQWPEGADLLANAARHGLILETSTELPRSSPATYETYLRVLRVNERFAGVATFMLAAVLAHELQHAAVDAAGLLATGSPAACEAAEQRGFEAEARFLAYLRQRMPGGLPTPPMVRARLPAEDQTLYGTIALLAAGPAPDPRLARIYQALCADF